MRKKHKKKKKRKKRIRMIMMKKSCNIIGKNMRAESRSCHWPKRALSFPWCKNRWAGEWSEAQNEWKSPFPFTFPSRRAAVIRISFSNFSKFLKNARIAWNYAFSQTVKSCGTFSSVSSPLPSSFFSLVAYSRLRGRVSG